MLDAVVCTPARPYCTDWLGPDIRIRRRDIALRRQHIQLNPPKSLVWMLHDIDCPDAYFRHRDVNLPAPNFLAENPENGHAHSGYLLTTPVAKHNAAGMKPLRYFADIERGIRRRLEADRSYSGFLTKNPWHPAWRTEWRRDEPFELDELNDALWPSDKRPEPTLKDSVGTGRNCDLFDALRQVAYQDVRRFKRDGTPEGWQRHLEGVAKGLNSFTYPLPDSEVRSIARSVAKWTWRRFDGDTLADLKTRRSESSNAKRWAGHVTPQALGLTRRQWERRERYRRRLAVSGVRPSPEDAGITLI
jgi:Replicase family/Primase C terminal 1 (PriCT-1)